MDVETIVLHLEISIFVNVCGPFDKSFRKAHYFVLFKDQFTKFCCVFFHRQKSDFANKDFLAFAGKLGHNVKEIISDNGWEGSLRTKKLKCF